MEVRLWDRCETSPEWSITHLHGPLGPQLGDPSWLQPPRSTSSVSRSMSPDGWADSPLPCVLSLSGTLFPLPGTVFPPA